MKIYEVFVMLGLLVVVGIQSRTIINQREIISLNKQDNQLCEQIVKLYKDLDHE